MRAAPFFGCFGGSVPCQGRYHREMNTLLERGKAHVNGSSSRRKSFAIVAGLVLLAILLLTLLPTEAKQFLHTRGRFHTAAHVTVFAALAFAAAKSSKSGTTLLLLFAALLCFGFATEFLEHLLDESDIEWTDVAGDTVGVLIGYSGTLVEIVRRRLQRPEQWV